MRPSAQTLCAHDTFTAALRFLSLNSRGAESRGDMMTEQEEGVADRSTTVCKLSLNNMQAARKEGQNRVWGGLFSPTLFCVHNTSC